MFTATEISNRGCVRRSCVRRHRLLNVMCIRCNDVSLLLDDPDEGLLQVYEVVPFAGASAGVFVCRSLFARTSVVPQKSSRRLASKRLR